MYNQEGVFSGFENNLPGIHCTADDRWIETNIILNFLNKFCFVTYCITFDVFIFALIKFKLMNNVQTFVITSIVSINYVINY